MYLRKLHLYNFRLCSRARAFEPFSLGHSWAALGLINQRIAQVQDCHRRTHWSRRRERLLMWQILTRTSCAHRCCAPIPFASLLTTLSGRMASTSIASLASRAVKIPRVSTLRTIVSWRAGTPQSSHWAVAARSQPDTRPLHSSTGCSTMHTARLLATRHSSACVTTGSDATTLRCVLARRGAATMLLSRGRSIY